MCAAAAGRGGGGDAWREPSAAAGDFVAFGVAVLVFFIGIQVSGIEKNEKRNRKSRNYKGEWREFWAVNNRL